MTAFFGCLYYTALHPEEGGKMADVLRASRRVASSSMTFSPQKG